MPKPPQSMLLLVAAASLSGACRSEPQAKQTTATAPPSASPAADASRPFVVVLPDAGAAVTVAPRDGGFSDLAGMWRGKMIGAGDKGAQDRETMMRIGPDGVAGIAIRPFKAAAIVRMGASAMCTIDGAIERHADRAVFVEHESRCRAQFAHPQKLGLMLKEPCVLSVVNLDKGGGEGEVFALRRRGCKTDADP
jgi:hypothetical protein